MATQSITIEKNPALRQSEDYFLLRRKGIEFIEQMGSRWWTDYNTHDPGITLLEALCYAITDLGYRTGWNVEDILAEPPGVSPSPEKQAFFTARDILTVNPLTVSDFRRILIDLDKVANAWLICKKCACEVQLYADCEEDKLVFLPPDDQDEIKVTPLGTYDVLLELEHDPVLGDLNDRKVRHTFIFTVKNDVRYVVTAEFRFPEWDAAAWGKAGDYADENGTLLRSISEVKLDVTPRLREGETDPPLQRWQQWQNPLTARVEIVFDDGETPGSIVMENVPLRLFGTNDARRSYKIEVEKGGWDTGKFDQEGLTGGVAGVFFKKMATVERLLAETVTHLHEHRNLCEDFCCISRVCVEDVAVCADVEVTPDADIERVLASVLFKIEEYFNPGIKFYTLQELLDEGMPVDEIFEGPRLSHGFVKKADLEAAQLKSQLRTSDIINQLVEIEGVVAVKNLLLTRYDQDGLPVSGVSDKRGEEFDPKKISAGWTLEISDRCQPRLYVDNSKFIFYKNGLPFIARPNEVQDTLSQLRGEDERLKIRHLTTSELDLPVPRGVYRSPEDYFPVQYSFPLTYGIGYDGVREPATEKRRAQAKQLKGFLLFFEQLIANYLAQLANVRHLFSLDKTVTHTYFSRNLRDEALIRGATDLLAPELDDAELQRLAESEPERLDRRNRFLDHLMARFAENFTDYALMLYSYETLKPVAQADLIDKKIAFLEEYPLLSRERARSFNYKIFPQDAENQAVLRKRIARLLGLDTAMEERIIVVEHLLLRPKFHGDALMEVCLGEDCSNCGSEDPYSFQLTLVMPGWADPFDENIGLRRFADRTIQLELPSHLLGKVCWVSNLDYGQGWENNLVIPLQKLLREEGKNAGGNAPSESSAQSGAEKIYAAALGHFREWFEGLTGKRPTESEYRTALDTLFRDKMALADIYSFVKNYDEIGDKIFEMLTNHFTAVAMADQWYLYDRFKAAWDEWLEANADFDWCGGQVVRKIELALIEAGISPKKRGTTHGLACDLAACFGDTFSEEIKNCVLTNKKISNKRRKIQRIFRQAFKGGKLAALGIPNEHSDAVRDIFVEIYLPYLDVTQKLWALLLRLSQLQSIYPPATLHDCDDSNDDNPVRLGSTMLGG